MSKTVFDTIVNLENHRNEVYLCGKVLKKEKEMFVLIIILVVLLLTVILLLFSVRAWKSTRTKNERQVKKDEDNLFDMLFRFISG